jgi:hypothetical protein
MYMLCRLQQQLETHSQWARCHARLRCAALRTGSWVSSLASVSPRPSYTKLGAPMPRPRRPPVGAALAATDLLLPDLQCQVWAAEMHLGHAEACGCRGCLRAGCRAAIGLWAAHAGALASKQSTLRPRSACFCWLRAVLHMLRFAAVPGVRSAVYLAQLRCCTHGMCLSPVAGLQEQQRQPQAADW